MDEVVSLTQSHTKPSRASSFLKDNSCVTYLRYHRFCHDARLGVTKLHAVQARPVEYWKYLRYVMCGACGLHEVALLCDLMSLGKRKVGPTVKKAPTVTITTIVPIAKSAPVMRCWPRPYRIKR